ncbi:hypothetical protein YSY43_20580 [Paenibacillus sp. YSY-4.3]
MRSIDFNRIERICAGYWGSGYFVGETIPFNKLSKFCSAISVQVQGHAIAFIDATVFGSGKNGLLITEAGVYWRNDWATDTRQNYLNWEEFIQVVIMRSGDYDIELGPGNFFSMSSGQFDKDALVQLLQDIQSYIITVFGDQAESNDKHTQDEVSAPPMPAPTEKWNVAIAGQSYGPYDIYLIKSLLGSGQIRPEESHVWQPGMPDWIPFMSQPEMAELVFPAGMPAPRFMPTPQSIEDSIEAALEQVQQAKDTGEPGSVDVNTASMDELIEVLGVGAVGAEQIVQQRDAIGGFRSPEEVGELLGLKPHQVARLRKRVVFTPIEQALSSSPSPMKPNARVVDY